VDRYAGYDGPDDSAAGDLLRDELPGPINWNLLTADEAEYEWHDLDRWVKWLLTPLLRLFWIPWPTAGSASVRVGPRHRWDSGRTLLAWPATTTPPRPCRPRPRPSRCPKASRRTAAHLGRGCARFRSKSTNPAEPVRAGQTGCRGSPGWTRTNNPADWNAGSTAEVVAGKMGVAELCSDVRKCGLTCGNARRGRCSASPSRSSSLSRSWSFLGTETQAFALKRGAKV